jgi:EmrB/QacA subfamily drug resistance transporter
MSASPHPRRWAALIVMLAGAFMTLIDMTVVNVAVPSIQTGLGAPYADAEWVISGYALSYGLLLIAGGRLGDLYGHRRLFLLALSGFVAASLLCGLTRTGGELIAARVLQGAAAGLMYPQVTAFIQLFFDGRERGKAYAVLGASIGLASVLGPLVGGLLVSADLAGTAWRPIFLVNVPIGIAAVLAARRIVPGSKGPGGRLDLVGLLLVSAGLFAVTLALIQGHAAGWAWWIYALLASAAALFAAFLAWERRCSARGAPTVLDPALFASRPFAAGLLIALVFFAGFSSLFFTISLYLQQGLGLSALATGAATVPFALGAFMAAAASETLGEKLGHRVVALGAALVLAGLFGVVAVVHVAGIHLHALALAPPLLVAGLGCGLVIAPLIELSLAGVPWQQAGAGAGVLNAAQRLGTAVGIALVSVALFAALGDNAGTAGRTVVPQLRQDLRQAGFAAQASPFAIRHFEDCFSARARAHDPTVAPPGCRFGTTAYSPVFAASARSATRRNFTHAFEIATLVNIAAVAITLLLALLLAPRRAALTRVSPAPVTPH